MEQEKPKYRVVEFKNKFTIQRYCKIKSGFLWWKKEKFEWLYVTSSGQGYKEKYEEYVISCGYFLTLESAINKIKQWETDKTEKPIIHEINL